MRNLFRFISRHGGTLRLQSLEISVVPFCLALALLKFSDPARWVLGLSLGWISLYLTLPFPAKSEPVDDILDKWGVRLDAEVAAFEWGPKRKFFWWYPWRHERRRSWMLGAHGLWIQQSGPGSAQWVPWYDDPILWNSSHPYIYKLESGSYQQRIAKIGLLRDERTCRFLNKTTFPWPWPLRTVTDYIEVQFSDEVGERSGSWKGGCIGCSYRILPSESPYETLKRMERERKF